MCQEEKIMRRGALDDLFSKQHKKQCEDDADNNGGDNWKVESKILFPDDDIPGKSTYPGDFFTN